MNEQEKNTENTSTPTPELNEQTTTSTVEETTTITAVTESVPDSAQLLVAEEVTKEIEVVPTDEKDEAAVTTKTEAEVPLSEGVEETATKVSPLVLLTTYAVKAKKWIYSRKYTISAVVLVIIALVGLLYIMEEQGKINTGVFEKVESVFTAGKAIAKVNDGKVTRKQLETSVSQISAGAVAQGMDVNEPELAAQIQSQAVEMLVNTELLMQEAAIRGIDITDTDVSDRITSLTEEVGGEAVLAERMAQFGIDDKTLRSDVRNELTIQALLDEVFAEKQVAITDEEVKAFYAAAAAGAGADLPALEDVSEQIKQQIQSTKEQDQVTSLIEELRGKATIEILI
jgi:SurA N-terminal domain